MLRPTAKAGSLTLGGKPVVIGTILDHAFLASARAEDLPCDLVEVRLDGFQELSGWSQRAERLERSGKPILATIRLGIEGGHWHKADEERAPIFDEALRTVSGIDIELQSRMASAYGSKARSLQKLCIVSHHDFQRTPPLPALEEIVRRGQEIGSVVKIASMINAPSDIEVLRKLLSGDWEVPLCLIGMGPLGRETRLRFPNEGSCLAYGYLDTPGAPGQYSAAELLRALHREAAAVTN